MKLALTIPGTTGSVTINNTPMNTADFPNLGATISRFLEVGLYFGGVLMFFWAIWGVFDYIRAEGNKDGLAKARKKIQWAIVGFVILLLAFFISDFLQLYFVGTINRNIDPLSM